MNNGRADIGWRQPETTGVDILLFFSGSLLSIYSDDFTSLLFDPALLFSQHAKPDNLIVHTTDLLFWQTQSVSPRRRIGVVQRPYCSSSKNPIVQLNEQLIVLCDVVLLFSELFLLFSAGRLPRSSGFDLYKATIWVANSSSNYFQLTTSLHNQTQTTTKLLYNGRLHCCYHFRRHGAPDSGRLRARKSPTIPHVLLCHRSRGCRGSR